ncbi:MAG: LLM class F420-dependent oxidoreductase [Novosphingobium sp.]
MKVGLIYPQTELKGDPQAVRDIGLAAQELGYRHLLAYDHPLGAQHANRDPALTGPYTEHDPFHDPFVMFAYLAGMTDRLEFISGVLVMPQRQTALVARQAADLDLLSGGRFTLGAGVGWNWVEYQALGMDFHTRGKRLEEQVDLLRKLWTGEVTEFEGRFHKVDRAVINPAPARKLPIYLGGFADVAFRRAARIADGFIFGESYGDVFECLERTKGYLRENGRSVEDFDKSINIHNNTPVEAVPDVVKRWRDAGGTHASVVTMKKGFKTAREHIDYASRVADTLDKAGLMVR